MNRYIVDEYYRDPALRQRLLARARRERSRVLHAGLAWLVRRLAPGFRPLRWTERLG